MKNYIINNIAKYTIAELENIYETIENLGLGYFLIVINQDGEIEVFTEKRILFKLKRIFNCEILHTKLGLCTAYNVDVDNLNHYIIKK